MPTPSIRAAAAAVVVLLLTGCSVGSATETAPAHPGPRTVRLPQNISAGGVVLYNRFTQRLLAYDRKTFAVTQESDAPNYIQYSFPVVSEYFTAGDSIGDDFSVLRVRDNEIETVVEMPPNTGIFPLATDGRRYLYTMSEYANGAETSRVIVSLDPDGTVHPYANATGLTDSGAIIGTTLHFTVFDEQKKKYDLKSLDLRDHEARPRSEASGLPDGGLFVHERKLFRSTGTAIVNGAEAYDCAQYCYFLDGAGVLVRVYVSKAAGLALQVVDTTSKKVLDSRADIIDFAVADGELTVYRVGAIDTITLPRGSA
jgi:hypothetical protein